MSEAGSLGHSPSEYSGQRGVSEGSRAWATALVRQGRDSPEMLHPEETESLWFKLEFPGVVLFFLVTDSHPELTASSGNRRPRHSGNHQGFRSPCQELGSRVTLRTKDALSADYSGSPGARCSSQHGDHRMYFYHLTEVPEETLGRAIVGSLCLGPFLELGNPPGLSWRPVAESRMMLWRSMAPGCQH